MQYLPRIAMIWCTLTLVTSICQAGELVSIADLDQEEVVLRAFTLDREQDLEIEGLAVRPGWNNEYCAAWILASDSREVVWEMDDAEFSGRRKRLAEFEDRIELPAGDYELYFATFANNWWYKDDVPGLLRLVLGMGRSVRGAIRDIDDLEITLRAESGQARPDREVVAVREALAQDAILSFTGVGDEEYLQQAFELDRDMEVEIYALGEVDDGNTYDGAWIVDAASGERVWEFDRRSSKRAGGAKKNRVAREQVDLRAGTYVAYYATDDSHSWPHFNMRPPHDPIAWGLTIRPKDPSALSACTKVDFEDPLDKNVLVTLTGMRNGRHEAQGFTLTRPMDVRIFALGEGVRRDMYDYGWILNARTHETVWRMRYRDTEHAGGDEKNRMINTVIELDAGSYIVHYVTDDSHAFRRWNAAAPFDQERWGITLTVPGDDFDAATVTAYDPEDDPATLVRITAVRNHEYEHKRFELERDQDVLVYALGEGRRNKMHDYGWIEDERGRTVWEMTYRQTEHAGGADKNRLYRDLVHLRAGSYEVFYETDGSHAYRRWNDAPPHDPEAWGITILKGD